jgi:hypothetical protein
MKPGPNRERRFSAVDQCGTPELPFPTEPEEHWIPVVDWEGLYEVSDQGRVRSLPRMTPHGIRGGRILKGGPTGGRSPRLMVMLSGNGRMVGARIHRMVLEAFVGPCPEGLECRHGPGGPFDNRLVNLSWGNHRDNSGPDKLRDGILLHGERNPNAKLSADEVATIRQRAFAGASGRSLAGEFGVHWVTINNILAGRTWQRDGHPELTRTPRRRRLTRTQVAEIKARLMANTDRANLAAEYRVSERTIRQIAAGRTWVATKPAA